MSTSYESKQLTLPEAVQRHMSRQSPGRTQWVLLANGFLHIHSTSDAKAATKYTLDQLVDQAKEGFDEALRDIGGDIKLMEPVKLVVDGVELNMFPIQSNELFIVVKGMTGRDAAETVAKRIEEARDGKGNLKPSAHGPVASSPMAEHVSVDPSDKQFRAWVKQRLAEHFPAGGFYFPAHNIFVEASTCEQALDLLLKQLANERLTRAKMPEGMLLRVLQPRSIGTLERHVVYQSVPMPELPAIHVLSWSENGGVQSYDAAVDLARKHFQSTVALTTKELWGRAFHVPPRVARASMPAPELRGYEVSTGGDGNDESWTVYAADKAAAEEAVSESCEPNATVKIVKLDTCLKRTPNGAYVVHMRTKKTKKSKSMPRG